MRSPFSAWRRPNPVFSEEYRTIREVLIASRHAAGLTQRALAARIGKCSSHVAKVEAGQRRVDVLELYQIAVALELEPAVLFEAMSGRLARLAAD